MLSLNPYTAMASGTTLVAIFLAGWQWHERRGRHAEWDPADRGFFRRQDLRRWVGIGMMLLLSVAIFAIEPSAQSEAPQTGRQIGQLANLVVLVALIAGLLSLALFDAMATYRFARHQRRELKQEHAKLMLDVISRVGSSDAIPRNLEKQRGASEA
jgi:uncharacterized membrane protein YphA (DoxX/SURF4 family)